MMHKALRVKVFVAWFMSSNELKRRYIETSNDKIEELYIFEEFLLPLEHHLVYFSYIFKDKIRLGAIFTLNASKECLCVCLYMMQLYWYLL